MVGTTDWVGMATFVTAFAAAFVSIVSVLIDRKVHGQMTEVHTAVTTPPDSGTIGQVVADTATNVEQIKTAQNGGNTTPPGG
jgi:hypothetical protein